MGMASDITEWAIRNGLPRHTAERFPHQEGESLYGWMKRIHDNQLAEAFSRHVAWELGHYALNEPALMVALERDRERQRLNGLAADTGATPPPTT